MAFTCGKCNSPTDGAVDDLGQQWWLCANCLATRVRLGNELVRALEAAFESEWGDDFEAEVSAALAKHREAVK